jgi:serine/threonine protein kinase
MEQVGVPARMEPEASAEVEPMAPVGLAPMAPVEAPAAPVGFTSVAPVGLEPVAPAEALADESSDDESETLNVPWVPRIKPPDHCSGCSVQKTDAPRCEHCGAAIRAGGYVVLRTISQGPHGRVYEALGPKGKVVALKELIFSLVPDAATLDAFQREAELLRALSHSQIPRLLDAFSEGVGVNTRLYLAQELVEGESLQDVITRAPLSSLEAKRMARQVLRVLHVLHGRDPPLLHRDIKPANLILRRDGMISLVDFGSARLLSHGVTHGATLVGTFGYMPPEQLGGTVDASCDVYALGATLMHALTGRRPDEMTRDGFQLDANRHLRHVEPGFRKVIKRMVAPSRADRFRSAGEALEALRPRWEVPVPVLGAVGVLALAAGLMAGRLWLTEPEEPRELPVVVQPIRPAPNPNRNVLRPQPGPYETAMLAISTREPGLAVYLDGLPTARVTPIPIADPLHARPGRHYVQFVWQGALTLPQPVFLRDGEVTTIRNIPMPPRPLP